MPSPTTPIFGRTLTFACPAAVHAPANDGAYPCFCGSGDRRFVFGLEGRIRDLQHVEHTHLDVVCDVGKDGGAAEETNLAFSPQVL